MHLVSAEYFERVRRNDDEDDVYMEARNERLHIRILLKKKKNAHPYVRWVNLRER